MLTVTVSETQLDVDLKTNSVRLFGTIIDKGRNLGAVGQIADRDVFPGLRQSCYSCSIIRFMSCSWPLAPPSRYLNCDDIVFKERNLEVCRARFFQLCRKMTGNARESCHSSHMTRYNNRPSIWATFRLTLCCLFGLWLLDCSCRKQGCTDRECWVAVATELCTPAPNIGGSSIWKLACRILARRILRWVQDFWKICALLGVKCTFWC